MIMGGFHSFDGEEDTPGKAVHPLTHEDAILLLKSKTIYLPLEEEIKDRSKRDWLAKTIVLIQTLWFVMQCIARGIESLPMTKLEIVTLAYTVSSLGMLIAWWDKPYHVDHPIRVFHRPETVEKGDGYKPGWFSDILNLVAGGRRQVDLHERKQVPMFYSGKPDNTYLAIGIPVIADLAFGAVHCIAWFFQYATPTEMFLWRLSSIALTAIPTLLFLSACVEELNPGVPEGIFAKIMMLLLFILTPLLLLVYIAARLSTATLAFINLTSLPPGAFQDVRWTAFIPHV